MHRSENTFMRKISPHVSHRALNRNSYALHCMLQFAICTLTLFVTNLVGVSMLLLPLSEWNNDYKEVHVDIAMWVINVGLSVPALATFLVLALLRLKRSRRKNGQ